MQLAALMIRSASRKFLNREATRRSCTKKGNSDAQAWTIMI